MQVSSVSAATGMIQGATATATSRTLHALPTEILLLVLSLLDPVDVLNVRKVCRPIFRHTHTRRTTAHRSSEGLLVTYRTSQPIRNADSFFTVN